MRPSHDVVNRYLQRLGERLIPSGSAWLKWVTSQDWPASGWRILSVRDMSVNAFSIGDGRIYLTDGSFNFVNNEAELAAILAHEIGHQLAGHFCAGRDQAFNERRQVGSLVQVIDINREIEADTIALGLLHSAGFPPRAMLEIVTRLPMTGDIRQHRLRLRKLTENLPPVENPLIYSSSQEFLQIKNSLPY